MKKFKILVITLVLLLLTACVDTSANTVDNNIVSSSDNIVHFIDVGQGDSILVESQGEYMLVDAGEEDKGDTVVNYIKNQGINKLKYVVATHPHSDHIGGMDDVINSVGVESIIMPDKSATTKCFENMLDAVESKNVNAIKAEAGNEFSLGSFNCKIVGPVNIVDETNDNSVVIKLTYGNDSILLTGDCGKAEENDILNSGADISADLLKAGHHGSSTSSTESFVNAVNPKGVIISCGKNNDYGHPHKEVMNRFNENNIKVYRTDEMGSIVAQCSGDGINIEYGNTKEALSNANYTKSQNIQTDNTYILNTKSKKYHKTNCSSAANIKNKEEYTGSIEELKNRGYSPCGICKPE